MIRTGFGYDSHRLVEARRLIIGGVSIPFDRGCLGHSDGDPLLHAITDAIIGALGEGDIGRHFPDTDPRYKDANSLDLLKQIVVLARERGFSVTWVDCVILIERPKMAPHTDAMRERILSTGILGVNIKAKTDEGMGFVGTGEGVAAYAVCIIEKP